MASHTSEGLSLALKMKDRDRQPQPPAPAPYEPINYGWLKAGGE